MNKEKIIKGLNITDSEEKLLFSKAFDLCVLANKKRDCQFSQFMDISKCHRFKEVLTTFKEIDIITYGGFDDCEREIIGFFSKYHNMDSDFNEKKLEFPIVTIRIFRKHKKFGQEDINHRHYLGSILNLGIDRGKIGDIIVRDGDYGNEAIVFIHESMADYIIFNLEKVSKTFVNVEMLYELPEVVNKKIKIEKVNISSLRLDVIIAEVFSLSRSKSQDFIKKDKVTVNWRIISNTSFQVEDSMMISLRGYGRFCINEILGITKKNKIVLEVSRYI